MAFIECQHKKNSNSKIPSNSKLLKQYIDSLNTQLEEQRRENEALSLERARLKVCWEMTLEELGNLREEYAYRVTNLENELTKQRNRKKFLQELLKDYGTNLEEMKKVIDNIIERPKYNAKY